MDPVDRMHVSHFVVVSTFSSWSFVQLSLFLCDNIGDRKQLAGGWFSAACSLERCNPQWQGRHGGRDRVLLATLSPQSGSRE